MEYVEGRRSTREVTYVPFMKKKSLKKIKVVLGDKVVFFFSRMADDECAFGFVCYMCEKSKMPEGEVMLRMDCCKAAVHRSCLVKHYPGLVNDKTLPCLKCRKVDAKPLNIARLPVYP